jgi:hypothetical protein
MEECIRRGQPPPESVQNAPELNLGLHLFYTAFLDLHGCRQLTEVMGPIDWLAIDRYCERYDITDEQYEDMHYFVAKLDEAFLGHHRNKTKTAHEATVRKAKAAAKKPVRRRK